MKAAAQPTNYILIASTTVDVCPFGLNSLCQTVENATNNVLVKRCPALAIRCTRRGRCPATPTRMLAASDLETNALQIPALTASPQTQAVTSNAPIESAPVCGRHDFIRPALPIGSYRFPVLILHNLPKSLRFICLR